MPRPRGPRVDTQLPPGAPQAQYVKVGFLPRSFLIMIRPCQPIQANGLVGPDVAASRQRRASGRLRSALGLWQRIARRGGFQLTVEMTGCGGMAKETTGEADDGTTGIGEQIIVKTYMGSQAQATMSFQADAMRMAAQGYFPMFQSWVPGRWRPRAFIAAVLLCLLIVGIPALIYMLIVTPEGALTVTYGFRGAPVD
jgi:hypothetical protein